jgi:hypothetical protein
MIVIYFLKIHTSQNNFNKYITVLYNFFITFDFRRFCQSGFYFDFVYKKFAEIFVRNFFIYTAQFFGEKYMIEGWTKKIFEKCIYYLNKVVG